MMTSIYSHPDRPRRRTFRRIKLISSLIISALAAVPEPGQAKDCADVELVLAIDGSGSINATEFSLQQQGYAAAFLRQDVQTALRDAGTVDVAVVLWGDTEIGLQIMPWVRLNDAQASQSLAATINGFTRRVQGNTGLGRALWYSLDLFDMPGRCGLRRIVNVSGDGHESITPKPRSHIPLAKARARAEAMGVEVNALAIENEVSDLSEWYRDRLLVGAGAFVMQIDNFDSFAEAIAKKLVREISTPNVASTASKAADRKT